MLAFTDEGIARLMIAATAYERDGDRSALLRRFSYLAERAPPARPTPAPSPDAERMRRYRERLRRGVAYVPLPVNRLILDYLVRRGLLPRDREGADRVEIGLAAATALERAAETDGNSLLRVTRRSGRRV